MKRVHKNWLFGSKFQWERQDTPTDISMICRARNWGRRR